MNTDGTRLYMHLAAILREQIRSGGLDKDDPLPSQSYQPAMATSRDSTGSEVPSPADRARHLRRLSVRVGGPTGKGAGRCRRPAA
jgi:hypothetical protein